MKCSTARLSRRSSALTHQGVAISRLTVVRAHPAQSGGGSPTVGTSAPKKQRIGTGAVAAAVPTPPQQQPAPAQPAPPALTRRTAFTRLASLAALSLAAPILPAGLPPSFLGAPHPAAAATLMIAADRLSTLAVPPAVIVLAGAPDPKSWDPNDARLRAAANALQSALNAESLPAEEAAWSAVVAEYSPLMESSAGPASQGAPWAADVVARALGNRGNARARAGGRMDEALADLNAAIALAPYSPDPVLNRGVVLEQSGRFDEAAADYKAVLAAIPADPSAWNNLGNVEGLRGNWVEAEACFTKAAAAARDFSFTSANRAAALFQLGRDAEAMKEFRRLLRRYPDFDDARAALAAILWVRGEDRAAAEDQWLRVADPRYRDRAWLSRDRRWPPRLVDAAVALMDIK
jgi:tetratricopeptide (TPR) repeat protein